MVIRPCICSRARHSASGLVTLRPSELVPSARPATHGRVKEKRRAIQGSQGSEVLCIVVGFFSTYLNSRCGTHPHAGVATVSQGSKASIYI
jgi:hypothetical protein